MAPAPPAEKQQHEQQQYEFEYTSDTEPESDSDSDSYYDDDPGPYFGNAPGPVPLGCFRLSDININNLETHHASAKDKQLYQAIEDYDISILGLQEVGVDWSRIPRIAQMQQRLNSWFEKGTTKCVMEHNRHDKVKLAKQWGGTGIIARNKISYYARGRGTDSKGLARWTWARYQGIQDQHFRFVSIYQPCRNTSGQMAVYAQHRETLQDNNDDREPRQAFLEDLKTALIEWLDTGDHIVVGGDVNESVLHPSIVDLFTECGLTNLIFDMHGSDGAPRSYYNTSEGRVVDGLWGTPGVEVVQCGYLEPGDFPGNHSLLWADITYNSVLGHNPPLPHVPAARRLKLHDSKVTKRYLKEYENLTTQHNLRARQFRLEASTTYGTPLTEAQTLEADAIDTLRTKCMLQAEHKCRKLHMGGVQFSPALDTLLKQLAFWECAITRRRGLPIRPELWTRKKRAAQITTPTKNLSLDDMLQNLKSTKKAYREAKKNHDSLRIAFIDTLSPKDRDRLKRVEAQRELGRAAKRVTGKLESKSVMKVIINGQECTKRSEIEPALCNINYSKIRASDDTTFLQPDQLQEFGAQGETEASDEVLEGTYTPLTTTDPYAQTLLQGLQIPDAFQTSPFQPRRYISTECHQRGWKRAKERTSAGMSGLHFGMFKAQATIPELAELDASMRSLAYTTGFSYRRWKRGLDVQLLKRSNDYRAEKLRTILLLEADFNMNNKVMGADAMRSGERRRLHTRDNYGGRKYLRSVEVNMNQLLTYNSLWGRRGRAIIMSNDAKGCYDRIAHIVVNLALRRFGIPKPALRSMLATIQAMTHHIRTAFGDSEGYYGNDPNDPPPAGILQGNGAGPAGWAAIAAVLVQEMRKAGFGFSDWTLIRDRAFTITCFAFVDDTDLIHANNDPTVSTAQLIQEAQEALNLWEGLLRASGGALAPEKSYWYLVEVIWKKGRWQYATPHDRPGSLHLPGQPDPVPRLSPSKAKEALGIMIRPDGDMKDEFKYLQKKIAKWCDSIRTKRLKPSEAWYCLNATIMKTIEYPLTATTFTRNQIDELMAPIRKTALNLFHVQSRLPHKLTYGTVERRGLGIRDPYQLQLIFHLQSILRHAHMDTPSNDLHAENMDLTQLYVGSSAPFWELPYPTYGSLAPKGWMKSTWEALHDTPLTIQGPDITVPTQRTFDTHLMDIFIANDCDDIDTLNQCRLFEGATTVADLVTACGNHIEPNAWHGLTPLHRKPPHWINTHRPGRKAWLIWQTALRKIFLFHNSSHLRLRQPLGPWNQPMDKAWTWWKDPIADFLYQRIGTQWIQWRRRPTRGTRAKYEDPLPIPDADIPTRCIRASVSVSRRAQHATVLNTGATLVQAIPPPPLTLQDRLANLPDSAKWAFSELKLTDDGSTIAQAIKDGLAIGVDDGSLKLLFGTAAFAIEGPSPTHRIIGTNQVPGPIREGDSHRCELSGLYGIVIIVHTICKHFNITAGSIKIACDNKYALHVLDPDFIPHTNYKNFDLGSAIWSLMQETPISWIGEHVKGHQDQHLSYYSLPRLAQLNIEMDLLAKRYWHHLQCSNLDTAAPTPVCHHIHGEQWQIWAGTTKLTHPSTTDLYNTICDPITQQWWVRNEHTSEQADSLIDWPATKMIMQQLPTNHRRWVTKHASENCGVGTTLVEWKQQQDPSCPRCDQPETTEHVMCCTGYEANDVWDKSIDKLQNYLTDTNTRPEISDAILHCLNQWRTSSPIILNRFPTDIQIAVKHQQAIGWLDLLESLPSRQWRTLQHQYYRQQNLRKSSNRWCKGLLSHLHYMAYAQWKHRNHIKHNVRKPRDTVALALIHNEITTQLVRGFNDLPIGDANRFQVCSAALFAKSVPYKLAWIKNLLTARQRAERIARDDAEWKQQSQQQSLILRIARGGKV